MLFVAELPCVTVPFQVSERGAWFHEGGWRFVLSAVLDQPRQVAPLPLCASYFPSAPETRVGDALDPADGARPDSRLRLGRTAPRAEYFQLKAWSPRTGSRRLSWGYFSAAAVW